MDTQLLDMPTAATPAVSVIPASCLDQAPPLTCRCPECGDAVVFDAMFANCRCADEGDPPAAAGALN